MKFIVTLFAVLISASTFAAERLDATGEEMSQHKIITGRIIPLECADSPIGIKTNGGEEICLGFNSDNVQIGNLAIGQTYTLGGEMTEDGFYPNEILD